MAYPSSVFLRLAPGPGPRPPVLCGALSASPRRKCWNLMRFRHLSLSCTPVRPLRHERRREKKGEGKRSVGGLDVLERARWSAGGNSAGRPRAGAGERRGIATRVHGRRRAGRSVDEARPYARARPPTARPPADNSIHRLQGDRHPFEPWIDESAVRKGRLRLSRLPPSQRRDVEDRGHRRVTHFRTLKSGSCRIFSHDPMPCFCTASRSACSSSSSQYPRKGISKSLVSTTRDFAAARARPSLGTTRGTFAGYRAVRPSKRQSARRDPIVSGLSHRSAVALRAYSIAACERREKASVRSRALISTAAL